MFNTIVRPTYFITRSSLIPILSCKHTLCIKLSLFCNATASNNAEECIVTANDYAQKSAMMNNIIIVTIVLLFTLSITLKVVQRLLYANFKICNNNISNVCTQNIHKTDISVTQNLAY